MDSRLRFVSENWRTQTVKQIAASLGTTTNAVYRMANQMELPTQKSLREELAGPSTDEIAARAAEVRSKWTDSEERKRRVGRQSRYEFPSFTSTQLFPSFQGQGR